MKEKGVVTLERFSTAEQAEIYRALLESAGIRVMITGEYVNTIYPIGSSWAGIELRVAPADEALAREILAARFDRNEFETETV
jgi:hypothetical protein